jgi:hypothetical protein
MAVLLHGVAIARPEADRQNLDSWESVEREAAQSRRLFAPWDLAAWQVEHGREVQDAGQRDSFLDVAKASRRWPSLFPRGAELEAQVAAVQDREDRDLKAGAYDVVFLHKGDLRRQALLGAKYGRLGWVSLAYPQGKDFQVILGYRLKPPAP